MAATYVAAEISKLLDRNGRGQVGLRERAKEIANKLGPEQAKEWLLAHTKITLDLRAAFERKNWAAGDCEGTGLGADDEMCELAFVRGHDKHPLFSSLLGTTVPIKPGAEGQHGISNSLIAGKPTFADLQPQIKSSLDGIDEIWWYNGEYDLRIKSQTAFSQGVPDPIWPKYVEVIPLVAQWIGSWNPKRKSWKFARLEGGHRAQGDCEHLINCLRNMSESDCEYANDLIESTYG
jgi:hypothetical protein